MKLDVSTCDGYLIAAGLRGPDAETGFMSGNFAIGDCLKKLFTARLRFMCGVVYIGATLRDTKYSAFRIEEFLTFALAHPDDKGIEHYLSHMNRAFGVLREDETWGEEACLLLTLADNLFYCIADPSDVAYQRKAREIISRLNERE